MTKLVGHRVTYSTIYLMNLETILMMEVAENLGEKETSKNPQKVNHAVSFHAIKTEALNLLFINISVDKVLSKLRALFLTNPTLDKKNQRLQKRPRLLGNCCITTGLNVNMAFNP